MSFLLPYIEITASTLFYRFRGRDDGLFTSTPVFTSLPRSTIIPVTSPSLGSSPATLLPRHTAVGASEFPDLSWPATPGVKEWVLICEDPDAPLPTPIVHGIYYGISPDVVSVGAKDFGEKSCGREGAEWKLGKNRRGNVYVAPRPLLGHGVHRYIFQVVGVSEELKVQEEEEGEKGRGIGKEELLKAVEGKVVCWGTWVGEFERKWE